MYIPNPENCFEASSALRHMTELSSILRSEENSPKEILCLYTDGGPDHRVTFLSVQIALICLFLREDRDMVIAVRTPPYNSWKDPAERVMSILNLGLQAVGLMRRTVPDVTVQTGLKSLSSMSEIRQFAEKNSNVRTEVEHSIEPVKELLGSVFQRLSLKGKVFKTFHSASEAAIEDLFLEILRIDPNLDRLDTTKAKVQDKHALLEFMKSHCLSRHYMFSVMKCRSDDCTVCQPPRLPDDVFDSLSHLPDPMPTGSDHYKPFSEVYGSATTEQHRPSLKEVTQGNQTSSVCPTTAQNAKAVIVCTECFKPRVIYGKKLISNEMQEMTNLIADILFTCGSPLGHEGDIFKKITVRHNIDCSTPMEVSYYAASMANAPACYHCGAVEELNTSPNAYPICPECVRQKKQPKKKQGKKFTPKD